MTGDRPVPPPEWELARVEGAAELLLSQCRHCHADVVVIARYAGGLPRAVELRHEPGCPDDAD